jgi:hypothetical protein
MTNRDGSERLERERALFEAYASEKGYAIGRVKVGAIEGPYKSDVVAGEWLGWQARAAINDSLNASVHVVIAAGENIKAVLRIDHDGPKLRVREARSLAELDALLGRQADCPATGPHVVDIPRRSAGGRLSQLPPRKHSTSFEKRRNS